MWQPLFLLLAALTIPLGSAVPRSAPMRVPIEILGADGMIVSRTLALEPDQSRSVNSLWLRVHGVRYAKQASIQVNDSPWIPLNNDTATVAEPGRAFGGIGGHFAVLALTLPLPSGTVVSGSNTLRFRFNQSDGLSSGYRVLALNFLTVDGSKVLPPEDFVEDTPESWSPPRPDAASIRAGRELWLTAPLVANSKNASPRIEARCADCHARDGRDLKYFNFSNVSIIARSRFHGLTTEQGEEIASYIRSLPLPNPGQPWNPPYQPGPGLDKQPISNWSAGAGLGWILDRDPDALPYLIAKQGTPNTASASAMIRSDPRRLAAQITPDVFRPDGDLNPREIPIALQLPDWNQWLPRIHPKDAWGPAFARSDFAAMYDGGIDAKATSGPRPKPSLRSALEADQNSGADIRPVVPAFNQWLQARRTFLGRYVKTKAEWSPELSDRVYSTQLWQLVKTWEITHEFGLEGRGRDLLGAPADARTWSNTVPAETAPAASHIPNGPAGIGGSALTNEYLSASWYELQIILNSGSHRHRDRTPVDWVYLIGQFRNLYSLSRYPEPVRLLVAVTKAMQSTDPRLGPDDLSHGWRPDRSVDPRILVSPDWASVFTPFPVEVRRALAESLVAAWLDKTQQYPIAKYLPLPSLQRDYSAPNAYADITGGKLWEAAGEFRAAGLSNDLLERMQAWGTAYTDRAARLQYH
jgi:hypothetical protein